MAAISGEWKCSVSGQWYDVEYKDGKPVFRAISFGKRLPKTDTCECGRDFASHYTKRDLLETGKAGGHSDS